MNPICELKSEKRATLKSSKTRIPKSAGIRRDQVEEDIINFIAKHWGEKKKHILKQTTNLGHTLDQRKEKKISHRRKKKKKNSYIMFFFVTKEKEKSVGVR